jgi:hypothetical protein
MKYLNLIILFIIVALVVWFCWDLTPAEVQHCLATSTDKSICK